MTSDDEGARLLMLSGSRKLGDPRIPLDDAAEQLAIAAQFAGAYGSPCRAIDEDGAERLTVRIIGATSFSLDCMQAMPCMCVPEHSSSWGTCAGACR